MCGSSPGASLWLEYRTARATPPCRRGLRHVSLKAGMRISQALRNTVWMVGLCLCAQEQQPPAKDAPAKEAPTNETKGLPPRLAPTDYQAQGTAGPVTLTT